VLAMLKTGKTPFEIEQSLQAELRDFLQKRSTYLMYTPEAVQKRGSINALEQKNTLELDFETVRKVIQRSMHDSAFPSAALGVLWKGKIVTQEAFGRMTYSPSSAKTTIESVYDMASLTKVLATTTCLMKLYDEGKIKLGDSVSTYIPEFSANGKGNVRIANLLLHNSGLAAFRFYDRQLQGAEAAMQALYNEKLVYKTGDSTVYSDLGFITLGEVVKRVSGKSLSAYFAENFARPLGLKSMVFVPSGEVLARCVPTEQDTGWKQAFTRPLVHDPRSALLGGVAGHAGLFASVGDVCTLMQTLYFPQSGKPALVSPETVKLFTTRHSKASTRAIGWDTKGEGKSSCGDGFAPTSFGHTGYTGTSVWCDPTKQLCVVFLSNRVFPTSENNKIRFVRPAVHDAVLSDVENAGK
jgi:serine-type D-Ala-D-Ala carboxypeptidase